jgi:UDP-N-acetylglucosamine 2-epimerase (non-hydrolysing)
VSRDLPLVWPMRRADTDRPGLARMLEGCQVTCIDELGHGGFLRLLCGATCALTDCFDVIEEAAALHVPAISLGAGHVGQAAKGGWLQDEETGTSVVRITRAVWQIAFNGGREIDTPPRWDGHAAPRIAAFLAGWLGRRAAGADALRLAVEASPG